MQLLWTANADYPVQSTVHELGSSTIYPPTMFLTCDLVSKVPKFPNFCFILRKLKLINLMLNVKSCDDYKIYELFFWVTMINIFI